MSHSMSEKEVKAMGWSKMTNKEIMKDLATKGINGHIKTLFGKRVICFRDPGTNEDTVCYELE